MLGSRASWVLRWPHCTSVRARGWQEHTVIQSMMAAPRRPQPASHGLSHRARVSSEHGSCSPQGHRGAGTWRHLLLSVPPLCREWSASPVQPRTGPRPCFMEGGASSRGCGFKLPQAQAAWSSERCFLPQASCCWQEFSRESVPRRRPAVSEERPIGPSLLHGQAWHRHPPKALKVHFLLSQLTCQFLVSDVCHSSVPSVAGSASRSPLPSPTARFGGLEPLLQAHHMRFLPRKGLSRGGLLGFSVLGHFSRDCWKSLF